MTSVYPSACLKVQALLGKVQLNSVPTLCKHFLGESSEIFRFTSTSAHFCSYGAQNWKITEIGGF